jgi:hypothetical protein
MELERLVGVLGPEWRAIEHFRRAAKRRGVIAARRIRKQH